MTRIEADQPVTVEAHPDGDGVHIDVRLLVAPNAGRFHLRSTHGSPSAGDLIGDGTVIGHVSHAGVHRPVVAFCSGVLVEVLAESDDQVRTGQPVAWVRPVSP